VGKNLKIQQLFTGIPLVSCRGNWNLNINIAKILWVGLCILLADCLKKLRLYANGLNGFQYFMHYSIVSKPQN